jgi:Tfp pilus assembly major pilin PilA
LSQTRQYSIELNQKRKGDISVEEVDNIWIAQNGEKFGPYSEEDIRVWLAEGRLAGHAMAWRAGMDDWVLLTILFPSSHKADEPPLPPIANKVPSGHLMATGASAVSTSNIYANRPGQSGTTSTAREDLPKPPTLHWVFLLILSILTLGVFGVVWSFIQANWIRKLDHQSKATQLLAMAIGCIVVGEVLSITASRGGGSAGLVAIGGLLILAYWVLYLVAYFSMAGSMRRLLPAYGLSVEIGGATLFFFTILYLQSQLSWLGRWKATGQTLPAVSKGAFWALYLVVPVFAIFAAIAIPAYQDYLTRSEVSEAVVLTDSAKISMAEYYANYGQFPADNLHAGLPQSTSITGKYVSSVDVSGGRIIAAFDTSTSNSNIRGKLFVLTPIVDSGAVKWTCGQSAVTSEYRLPDKYLPASCRE